MQFWEAGTATPASVSHRPSEYNLDCEKDAKKKSLYLVFRRTLRGSALRDLGYASQGSQNRECLVLDLNAVNFA